MFLGKKGMFPGVIFRFGGGVYTSVENEGLCKQPEMKETLSFQ